MSTKGNLELRLGTETWQSCTNFDGYDVYKAVPKLVEFLDSVRDPTVEQFKHWFEKTSKEVFGQPESGVIGGVPREVVIDFSRRLLLHTGDEEDYETVSKDFQVQFENACILLREKYKFTIFNYIRPEMR